MSYSSASEGEIIESDEETKATTTRPSSKNGGINGIDRPRSLVSGSDRLLQLDGAHDEDSTSLDYGNAPGSKRQTESSRNPVDHQPHGQKRGYPDDPYTDRTASDPRRFKVHYENSERSDERSYSSRRAQDSRDSRDNRHGSYEGRHGSRNSRYDDDRRRRAAEDSYKRSKDYRDRRDGRGSKQHTEDYRSRYEEEAGSRRSSTASSSYRESTPPNVSRGRGGAEKQSQAVPTNRSMSDVADPKTDASGGTTASEAQPAEVDEAALIEERRKRREALRAKHKTQEQPLLHKALHVGISNTPQTPGADDSSQQSSREVSPTVSSPATPQQDSPSSPALVNVADDFELANHAQDATTEGDSGEGPSAADYDPSMDQEEKLREQRALHAAEATAASYDETKDDDRVVPVPVAPVEELKAKQSKEFDMFADDDDDDMFAPETATKHKKDEGTQAVHMPEAKQLDRSLLDDWDDPEGYYRIILGELLDGRYHVQTNLGKGVFSAVVRALDTKTDKLVAIKVIRKQESMYKAGIKEIEALQSLAEADPEDKKHVIRLERQFEHKGHLCMVFENLSINLREVLKKFGRDVGINIKAVRAYAQQIFLGLSLLKKCELLHADLKPDNILVNESRSQLKIADLGSAIPIDDNEITDVLVSRFYRAPEIMLGIKGDYALDMWSIGCTLFEMYTGKICFTGPTNNQMLKGIMECRGKIPNRMIKKSAYWPQHFDPDGTFLSQETDSVTRKDVVRRMNIVRTVPTKELRSRLFANAKGMTPAEAKELGLFADLLDKCLQVDPQRRISPNDALRHGFINRSVVAVPAK